MCRASDIDSNLTKEGHGVTVCRMKEKEREKRKKEGKKREKDESLYCPRLVCIATKRTEGRLEINIIK